MDTAQPLRNFLESSYEELERLNLYARSLTAENAEVEHTKYLTDHNTIKAVIICFSDIEGRLHMLDYDKKFFLGSLDALSFDGSSVKGLSDIEESDLRLSVDWTSFTLLPSDIFGAGKVLIFANICNRDGTPYASDFRAQLQHYANHLKDSEGLEAYMAPEIEGLLLQGVDAEQKYESNAGFKLVSTGGYFHSLPLDNLRRFIDTTAEALRAMGFKNEKDHPEVAPSQFEINFSYTDLVRACDQVQLYKVVCRQIAMQMNMTATFLPKPIQGINGNGMHVNISLNKNDKNIFYDKKGRDGLSVTGWEYLSKILNRAPELCLLFNSSVNAYRRLDPEYEAPNQIKVSANDRSAMIRIPYGNERTARIEIRSVAPDSNPYLVLFALLKTGIEDEIPAPNTDKRPRMRMLPGTIHDAIRQYKSSEYVSQLLGESSKQKYLVHKQIVSNRNPRELGNVVKDSEVWYHHEVANQFLWNKF